MLIKSALTRALEAAVGHAKVHLRLHQTKQIVLEIQFNDMATAQRIHELMLTELVQGHLSLELDTNNPRAGG